MCRFCGAAMQRSMAPAAPGQAPGYPPQQQQQQQQQQQHQAYAPATQAGGYGAPAYPPPPAGGYGAPGYPQQQGYAPPQPYPQPGYHPPPQGYGQPPVASFGGGPPVQQFGAGYHSHVDRGWWGSSFGTFFWARLAIAAIAIGVSLIIACVSAIANG
jgi:hypothetical protein